MTLALLVLTAAPASARTIKPHFEAPWRDRVAAAQAAYRESPTPPRPRAAPPGPVRSANEAWDVAGLIVAWDCSSSTSPDGWDQLWIDIIDAAWDNAHLYIYIITDSGSTASDVARCQQKLQNATGRDPSQATWFNEQDDYALDSIWLRDYGPFFVFDPDLEDNIVDADYTRYNRWRDDGQPAHFASEEGFPLNSWDFATEGGNFLPNGDGICLVSETIYGLNPGMNETEIEQAYLDYLGCTNLIVLPAVEHVTGHVDMWMFWIDHKTLAVAQYTSQQNSTAHDEMQTAIDDQLTGLVDPITDEPIELVMLPMPSNSGGVWRTYTNGTFVDDKFLMPVYYNNDSTQAEVTSTLEAHGVTVVPIDADIIISSAGAIHCITKTIPSVDGLPGGDGDGDADAGVDDGDGGVDPIADAGVGSDGGGPGQSDAGVNGGDGDPDAGCGCVVDLDRRSSAPGGLLLLAITGLLLLRRRRSGATRG